MELESSSFIQSQFIKQRQAHIYNLLLSHSSFLVVGPRGCGKTTFIQHLLQRSTFPYIKINCILGEKKHNFIKIIWTQIKKLFSYQNNNTCVSLETLARNMITLKNQIPKEDYDKILKQGVLYVFADNMQQLHVNEKFIANLFGFRQNVELKIAFIFCGINTNSRLTLFEKPICDLVNIMIPKPDKDFIENIIRAHIKDQLFSQIQLLVKKCIEGEKNNGQLKQIRKQLQQTDKFLNLFSKHIAQGVILMETDLEHIKRLSFCFMRKLIQYYNNLLEKLNNIYSKTRARSQDQKYKIHSVLNDNYFKSYFNKICQYGSQKAWQVSKRLEMEQNIDDQYFQKKLFYPQLIRTSLFLAQVCPQVDDYRRFKQYKRKTKKPMQFKIQKTKVKKHNPFRILSITESLQSQLKQNKKQRCLQTHSMDFYTCLQYLQQQGDMRIIGRSGAYGLGKLQAKTNEKQTIDFLKQIGLKIEQYKF